MEDWKKLEEKLVIGAKIKLGKKYCKEHGSSFGKIITLEQGYFEYDNGLYCETQTAPSIYDSERKEFESIYHLFGNKLENWMDCELV